MTKKKIAAGFALGLVALTAIKAAPPEQDSSKLTPLARTRAVRARDYLKQPGLQIRDLARMHGVEQQDLERAMRDDRDLWVDEHSHLFYACEGLEMPVTAAALSTQPTAISSTSIPNSTDSFKLHSLPGASRVIYLDFNGHVTRGTQWNATKTSGADIVSAPFDMDGNPTSFSTAELDRIKRIWQRVAEDFSPFAIDVTTEEPSIEALRRSSSTDLQYGVRVVISPSSSWYGNAGGVAYLSSFQWNSDTPAFVFCDKLGPNNEKYVAEAISHETGHTFGLSHDGKTDGTAYYSGQGNWAPIMGVGYYKAVTQWSKGEYANANNTEDDLSKIQTYGGPLGVDDYGNDPATAAPLVGPSVLTVGVIETRTDVDVFQFNTGAGTVTFTAAGVSIESNCDLKLELLNASGSVLTSGDPTGLSASISANLAAGTYFLRVQGVGAGDPVTTGYSDYGSLGEYKLSGTLVPGIAPVPPTAVAKSLVLSGVAPLTVPFSSEGSTDTDGTITSYSWNFGDGYTSTAPNPTHVYTAEGAYNAQLTVIDNSGLAAIATVTIQVTPQPNQAPLANATASATSGIAPAVISFSSAGSSDPDGVLTAFHWSFGDGTSSTSQNPVKTFTTAGSYSVVLTVTDERGASASASVAVTISTAPVTAQISSFDGSFESVKVAGTGYNAYVYRPSIPNYKFSGQCGIAANGSGFTLGNPAAPEGSQVAFVQKAGSISLTVSYPAGTYTLGALVANRANYGGAQTVVVALDGQTIGTWKGGKDYTAVSTLPFTVTSGTHTLTFTGQQAGDCTLLVDKLQIQRVN